MDVQTENLTEYILVHYRWILVLFLLPMSAIWKVYSIIRNYLVFKLNSAPKLHDKKVKNVQKQIRVDILTKLARRFYCCEQQVTEHRPPGCHSTMTMPAHPALQTNDFLGSTPV
ncbi:Delta(24)-sterol reductase [Eumeta japonica]|uniref:Delta(24)-sterol reductase n=1 Tax=Eumeta variegata TaxID=151549 RepID=A0A4C2A8D6_EUMVA|nr:Delta(24)-sterol reductase [Eumeta japonica]